MNGIVNKNKEYIGQYLHIENNEYCTRTLTRLYNLSIEDHNFFIGIDTIKEILCKGKYKIYSDKLYVSDPETDQTILKSVILGSYAVFIAHTKKLYLLSKQELEKFLKDNKYEEEVIINFVLGIEDTDNMRFNDLHIIQSNSLKNAKEIYKERYNTKEDPIFIGLEEDKYLYMPTDGDVLVSKLEKDILIDNI